MKAKILLIDDEEGLRFIFKNWLTGQGYEIFVAADYDSAIKIIFAEKFDLIFVDILLGEHSGIEILKQIKQSGLLCPVVMITGQPDIRTTAESLRLGAFDYLIKPIHKESLIHITQMALEHKALVEEKERYRKNLDIQNRICRELYEVGKIFNSTNELASIFKITTQFVIDQLNFDRCLIFLKSGQTNDFQIHQLNGYSSESNHHQFQQISLSPDNPLLLPLWDGAEKIFCEQSQSEYAMELGNNFKMTEFVIYPLVGKSKIPFGLLVVGNFSDNIERFARVQRDNEFMVKLDNLVILVTSALKASG